MAARALAATFTVMLATAPASAHHSRANFDLDTTIDVEGTVTEFTWQNPHAFAVVEGHKAGSTQTQKWTFELNSTPVLIRMGWSPDTLKVGDRVVARGNPDRNADRRFIYATLFVRDGQEIWAWGGPQLSQFASAPAPSAASSTDFTGVWRLQRRTAPLTGAQADDRVLVNTLPVTAKGQAQVDTFDPDENPDWDCLPQSLPALLTLPYPVEITRPAADTLVMHYELNEVERVVDMGMTQHPANATRTPVGHSIGRIENGELVIETAAFTPVKWGNGRGVDSGEQKTTVERYALGADGKTLSVTFTMTDPEYLTRPVTLEQEYYLHAGYKLQQYLCDPTTSRRHLTAGEE